jgi:thiol-disulfide isomerase/thioredoxin
MKPNKLTRLAALSALVTAIISTQAATVHEGDTAPKLDVSKWVQGEPVKEFKPGTVYIMAFWATWCGPCREEIPYLNQLHKKYKDRGLVVIGQDVWEKDVTKVGPFIKQMGEQMTYRIALDQISGTTNEPGRMAETWLKAADEGGIPTTFLIDKQGRIALIDEIDEESIEQVLAGTFDARKRAIEREGLPAKVQEWNNHKRLAREAWQTKQWDKSMSEIDEMDKIFPPKKSGATLFIRITVLISKGDFDDASEIAIKLSNDNKDDADLQNRIVQQLTTQIVTNSVILNTADLIIQRAIVLTNRRNPQYLDTQARVAFLQGKKQKAITMEAEAISLTETKNKDAFQRSLDSYKEDKLPGSE